jgi:hypothetical protein
LVASCSPSAASDLVFLGNLMALFKALEIKKVSKKPEREL